MWSQSRLDIMFRCETFNLTTSLSLAKNTCLSAVLCKHTLNTHYVVICVNCMQNEHGYVWWVEISPSYYPWLCVSTLIQDS